MMRYHRSRRAASAPASPAAAACLLLCGVLLGLPGDAEAQKAPGLFDAPVKKQTVTLADYPNPGSPSKLSCAYYPRFMVKEVDAGEKGAYALAIAPLTPGAATDCVPEGPGDIAVKDWAGYFAGVKGDYVFFDADDGYNSGFPFAVFSGKTGEKLFEDSRDLGTKAFRSIKLVADGIVLRYRRAYQAACSIYQDRSGCWGRIRKDAGLPYAAAMPDCNRLYEAERKRTPKFAKEVAALPSMIGYEAEATYRQATLAVASLPGTIKCWLPD